MNKLCIIGNLTQDPQSRVTQSGHNITAFTVAVNRRRRSEGQPEADFFRITTFDKLAEICQRLVKGKKVAVSGSVSVSTYRANDGTFRASMDVMADEVDFLSPKDKPEPQKSGYQEVADENLPWG